MRIAVVKERTQRERRVALMPEGAARLRAAGHVVLVEEGAGVAAGADDDAYRTAGAEVADRATTLGSSELIVAIDGRLDDAGPSHTVIGLLDPLWNPDRMAALAAGGATFLSLELMPRITRAQSMDVLSSTATVAGNEAVLLAARRLPKMFPLMMTAAGTVPAARVLVLGAGVAGLQAIATARRLGAIVEAYDVRPAAAEQIRSLGAKALTIDLDTTESEDAGGYARQQSDEIASEQQQLLASHVAQSDVVITTAAIPGAKSPILLTGDMVASMRRGSVVIDMAAERGGNCELTRPDDVVEHDGVLVMGPTDLASGSARTASLMFSNNVVSFLEHLIQEPEEPMTLDDTDEITAATLVARGGAVIHPRVLERAT